MRKFVKSKLKEEKGLTLIELLAVIVILGIIAAIAIPAIGNIITNSKVNSLMADGQNALSAANIYFADTNSNEATLAQLKDGYLDDEGGFKGATDFKVVKKDGGNELTGTAKNGDISVKFSGATNAQITAADNKDGGTNVEVTR